jgi:hypothetical protein
MSTQTLTYLKGGMMYTIPVESDPDFYSILSFVNKKPGRMQREDVEERKRLARCYLNYVRHDCQYTPDIMSKIIN